MKLILRVKIAHSFIPVMSKLFQLSFSACLGGSTSDHDRIFSKPTAKTGEIVAFSWSFSTIHESWFERTAELSCSVCSSSKYAMRSY